jgi:hypothetical protein
MQRLLTSIVACLWLGQLGFAQAPRPIVRVERNLPNTVVERLKMTIELEKDLRGGLEESYQQIFAAVDVRCSVDGPAIKLLGITRNEKQHLRAGLLTVWEAALEFSENKQKQATYKGLVYVVDEKEMTVTVTTREGTAAKGWRTFDLAKFREE